jgi:hypothetical protein
MQGDRGRAGGWGVGGLQLRIDTGKEINKNLFRLVSQQIMCLYLTYFYLLHIQTQGMLCMYIPVNSQFPLVISNTGGQLAALLTLLVRVQRF